MISPSQAGLPAAALAALLLCPSLAAANPGDVAAITSGVREVVAAGVPGPLSVFGPGAFAVVPAPQSGGGRAPLVAAARWGRGRVVAFGHTGYFSPAILRHPDTALLLRNAVRWSGAKATPKIGCLGLARILPALRPFAARAYPRGALGRALSEVEVLCVAPTDLDTPAARRRVADFTKAGGGIVLAGLGWGWQQLNPSLRLTEDHPGNLLLSEAGLVWADGYTRRSSREGFKVEPPGKLLAAGPALELLLAQSRGEVRPRPAALKEASRTVIMAGHAMPAGDTLLRPTLARLEAQGGGQRVPSAKAPLRAEEGLPRVLLSLQCARLARGEFQGAHPAAAQFPGPVPKAAPRLRRRVTLDAKPGWQSTGLYAAPGEVVRLSSPRAIPSLRVRIGCHTDRLYHKESWRRAPEISLSRAMPGRSLAISNAFGGLIYLEAKVGTQGAVTIEGAVAAPRYVLGQTDLAAWRETIRHHPAPWAELASDKIVVSVPSRHVRGLSDPQRLMAFWDRIADACADLAAIPRERARPERYVADVQISAGYMHAGYPIMTHLDAAEGMARFEVLSKAGNYTWGLFHELGHNHQESEWTFGGTGEVTCNLFTLYVLQEVCGVERPRAALYGAKRSRRLNAFFQGPRSFAKWKSDPFLALLQYMQLQEAFGWEPFKRVFRDYRALPHAERPRSDAERRDQWLIRFSRAVGINLGPFFETWGVPTSEAARASLRDLPDWLLGGLPR
jgi:enhancin-like peptidase M60 family/peptidase M60-like protein